MAVYRRVYDSRHLQADCQEPGSAPPMLGNRVWATFLLQRGGRGKREEKGSGEGKEKKRRGKGWKEWGRDLTDQCQTASYARAAVESTCFPGGAEARSLRWWNAVVSQVARKPEIPAVVERSCFSGGAEA